MAYSDLRALAAYQLKHSGAALEVLLYDAEVPGSPLIGAAVNVSFNEEFGKSPVEEAGNDGVDEFVDDRHTGRGNMQAFWTPAWGDRVLTRQDFIDKRFVVIVRIAAGRPGAGTVTDAAVGVAINSVNYQHGARGPRTMDMGFMFTRRYSGAEWAALAGA